MMKNVNIIKKNHDFQSIINNNSCIKGNQFLVYVNKSNNNFRYGVSVGKKLGNAVLRNKVKRQVRMMVRSLLSEAKTIDKMAVIIVRKSYFNFSYLENFNKLKDIIFNRLRDKVKKNV